MSYEDREWKIVDDYIGGPSTADKVFWGAATMGLAWLSSACENYKVYVIEDKYGNKKDVVADNTNEVYRKIANGDFD